MKAVLFFDIDMTLTDSVCHEVPESAVRAIAQARANGHLCFVNTGRPFGHIDPCVRAIPFDGFVCGCGIQLRMNDPALGCRIVYDVHPTAEVQHAIRDTARQSRIPVVYEDDTCIAYDAKVPVGEGWLAEMRRLARMGVPMVTDAYKDGFRFAKFLVDEGTGPEYEAFTKLACEHFGRTARDGFFEYVPKGCTKGTGLANVMRTVVKGYTSFAFGDSTNDLEMLSHADVAVVMENGMEEAKRAADFVTKSVEDGGIAYAMEHYGLI